jgi:hypothetical protein
MEKTMQNEESLETVIDTAVAKPKDEQEKGEDLKIEIVDDTPEKDRGRKPLGKKVDIKLDEVQQYTADVQKRINELTHAQHDERRAKEAVIRERDEAIRVAKQIFEENQKLKKVRGEETGQHFKDLKEKAATELEVAKKKLKEAFDAGDGAAMAEAQAEISKATLHREYNENLSQQHEKNEKEALQKEKDDVKQQNTEQPQKKVEIPADPNVEAWGKKNKWFGNDEEMTSFSFGVHEKLVRSGLHPIKDAEEYYKRIDARMREKFPEYEWEEAEEKPGTKVVVETKPKKAATIVAPVQRTSQGGRKVTLTTTQVQIAKRLGVTPEQYAREVLKMEAANG